MASYAVYFMERKSVDTAAIASSFRALAVQHRPRGNTGRKNKYRYLDCYAAFDIESTSDSSIQQAWMYVWQFALKNGSSEIVITGRTWPQYKKLIGIIENAIPDDCRLLVWIENLSFEWQFLKGIFPFQPDDVFAMDTRKVLKASCGKIEYRCSYLQSNMGLALLTHTYHAEHEKLSGDEYDYSVMRYPWTPLTDQERKYQFHDVLGLVEAMEKRCQGESFYTLPLTSTGYVRRAIKLAMRPNRSWLHQILPDLILYYLMRLAFRGGNTHANRRYSDRIIGPVWSFDRISSYPDVQCNCLFPMSAFQPHANPTVEYLQELIQVRHRACICRLFLWECYCSKDDGFPYLSYSKCERVKGELLDNGRILYAEYLETVVTDIDFEIIIQHYQFFDIAIDTLYSARYGKLPAEYTGVIKDLYTSKTELKNVPGMEENYTKSKNMLNSVYGCSVQVLLQTSVVYNPYTRMFDEVLEDPEELLKLAYRNPYQSYAWGVWTTAHARRELQAGLDLAGTHAVYCDTDSVKVTGTAEELEDLKRKFEELNRGRYIKRSRENGAVAKDRKGNDRYMGVFEIDGTYQQFVTLGSKKYAYIDDKGLHCTTAGVSKKYGAEELQAAGGLPAYKEGFTFVKAGGTEAVYNDMDYGRLKRDGHYLQVTSNVCLLPSTYTLGITAEYAWLLDHPEAWALDADSVYDPGIFDDIE